MRQVARAAWMIVPILIGVALGESTVGAMQVSAASYEGVPPPEQVDRYAMGQSWAAKHHPEGPDNCPSIDLLFQSGCIAATRY